MKTQIIQLSQKEDIISVKEKMSWCQTGRILLVWPQKSKVLNQELELTLIKRYAEALGCKLAFVCMDPQIRQIGSQLGLPVFDSARQAQEQEWNASSSKKLERRPEFLRPKLENVIRSSSPKTARWTSHPIIRTLCLGISVFAIIALAVFIIPGAKVTLLPNMTTQSVQLDVYADQNANNINYFTNSIPIYRREVIVQGSDVISTTGYLAVPEEPAKVSLQVTNKSRQAVTIPPGTDVSVLGVNPVRFKTVNVTDVIVEPGDAEVVKAQAIKPGSTGNIPASSLLAIAGDLGTVLEVTNPQPAAGGMDVQIKSPSEQDLQTLRNRLSEKLRTNALIKLQSSLSEQDILVTPSVEIQDFLEETSDPAIGAPGTELSLFMRVRVRSSVIAGVTLARFVTPILDASQPKGYSPVNSSLEISLVYYQKADTMGRIPVKISATRTLKADIPTNQLAYLIRGETVAGAMEKLSSSTSFDTLPEISLLPRWWPRLPFLAMRISIVQAPTQ